LISWFSTSTNHSKEKHARYFKDVKTPMLPPGTFDGKAVFITAGGTGLGKCMATMLSQLGAQVAIISRFVDFCIGMKQFWGFMIYRCSICLVVLM
jgi:hypothetical protein